MESKYWGQEIEKKNCARTNVHIVGWGEKRPKKNTELSFGEGDKTFDFIVSYYRAKPLNRFQIWMYKVCFGIRARNM